MSRSILVFTLMCVSAPLVWSHDAAEEMTLAAKTFLSSLSDEQKARATFDFEAPFKEETIAKPGLPPPDERRNWHYVPRTRSGLPLKDITAEQRLLAHGLLSTGLSHRGYTKAVGIMSLEGVLAALENNPKKRDPELYYFSIFGTPGKEPWGWRVEGHHLSLNFTISAGNTVMTPSFFGTNPGEVKQGPRTGTRVLEAEEELGRSLVKSLDEAQLKKAVILEKAPQEVLNVPGRNDSKPEGIPWADLPQPQRETLTKLIREYLFRHRPDVAETEFAKVMEKTGTLHFAWAGGLERGEPHYYRVQGGTFVLEYDNVQNGANHVHSVWRDFDRDFGADVLAEHYKAAHGR
jgi:hypothetical protein